MIKCCAQNTVFIAPGYTVTGKASLHIHDSASGLSCIRCKSTHHNHQRHVLQVLINYQYSRSDAMIPGQRKSWVKCDFPFFVCAWKMRNDAFSRKTFWPEIKKKRKKQNKGPGMAQLVGMQPLLLLVIPVFNMSKPEKIGDLHYL